LTSHPCLFWFLFWGVIWFVFNWGLTKL